MVFIIILNSKQIVAAATSEQADEWIAAIRAVSSLYAPPPETPNGTPKVSYYFINLPTLLFFYYCKFNLICESLPLITETCWIAH